MRNQVYIEHSGRASLQIIIRKCLNHVGASTLNDLGVRNNNSIKLNVIPVRITRKNCHTLTTSRFISLLAYLISKYAYIPLKSNIGGVISKLIEQTHAKHDVLNHLVGFGAPVHIVLQTTNQFHHGNLRHISSALYQGNCTIIPRQSVLIRLTLLTLGSNLTGESTESHVAYASLTALDDTIKTNPLDSILLTTL